MDRIVTAILALLVGAGAVWFLKPKDDDRIVTWPGGQLEGVMEVIGARQTQEFASLAEKRGGPFGISGAKVFFKWQTRSAWGVDLTGWSFRPEVDGTRVTVALPPLEVLSMELREPTAMRVDDGLFVNEADFIAAYYKTMIEEGDARAFMMTEWPEVVAFARASIENLLSRIIRGLPGAESLSELNVTFSEPEGPPAGDTRSLPFEPTGESIQADWDQAVSLLGREGIRARDWGSLEEQLRAAGVGNIRR